MKTAITKLHTDTSALCEKCPYMELFWSAFSRIRTEYGEIFRICSKSVQLRNNTDQNNSEYRHFLRSTNVSMKFGGCYFHCSTAMLESKNLHEEVRMMMKNCFSGIID